MGYQRRVHGRNIKNREWVVASVIASRASCCACSLVKWVISTILGVIIIIAIVFCIGYFGFGWFKHDDPTKLASLTIPDEMEPLTRAGRSIILRTIGAGMQ